MTKIHLRKTQTIGQALRDSFSMIVRNFKDLLLSLVIVAGPVLLGIVFINVLLIYLLFNQTGIVVQDEKYIWLNLIGLAIFSILGFFLFTTVVLKYIKLYNNSKDGVISRTELKAGIYRETLRLIPTGIGILLFYIVTASLPTFFIGAAGFINYFFISIYTILILFIGSILPVFLHFFFMLSLEEEIRFRERTTKFLDLLDGNWMRTFTFAGIISLIIIALNLLIAFPSMFIIEIARSLFLSVWFTNIFDIISTAEGFILLPIIITLQIVAGAVWYYGLSEQYDGVGAFRAMEQIGQESV